MRARGVPTAALLLVLASVVLQITTAEDIYWEGEEDASNEFLEVKEDDSLLGGHLKRLKRAFDFFSLFSSSTPAPENLESVTDGREDEEITDDKDEDLDADGSGQPDRVDPEPKEKTLRVTFVVIEPYRKEYSNRDSVEFQSISRVLASAADQLFDSLPGNQRATLVRIESRESDEFSCKVTLEIVTTGFDDTDRIASVLRNHIKNARTLGSITVSDVDFFSSVIDPGTTPDSCAADELRCDGGRCIPSSAWCNGRFECADKSDETGCPDYRRGDTYGQEEDREPEQSGPTSEGDQINESFTDRPTDLHPDDCIPTLPCTSSSKVICESQRCDGVYDCPLQEDEQDCNPETPLVDAPVEGGRDRVEEPTTENDRDNDIWGGSAPGECHIDELTCDVTRCVSLSKRCDGNFDCDDATDEQNCGPTNAGDDESCSADDFRCNNGKCIESSRRCDRVTDCEGQEDEHNCDCRENEFRCVGDGSCIELRKKCDGVNHCNDGSDEFDCACSSDQWQCDHGNCIKRSKRCDGRVDCPTDRSDERHCVAKGYFKCKSGKLIPEHMKCNRQYDCLPEDFSDEKNCPCGEGDFQCDNGHCIPASKHCDRTHDCQDGSDERDCTYGTVCMAYEFKCTSGQCIRADAKCNGTTECNDGSDERNCPCKRDDFRCRDGSCISIARRCNGIPDCSNGEDENSCGTPAASCPPGSFVCDPGSSIQCAKQCDGVQECDRGEDEQNCEDCNHRCDNKCLDDSLICDGIPDCSDQSDEIDCDHCDGPKDFRCKNGQCLNIGLRCNGVPECNDRSDELNCNETMIASTGECREDEFQCKTGGNCINREFVCDENDDCLDGSDEENCAWFMTRPSRSPMVDRACHESEFTCYNGRCIPHVRRCDNIYDCSDFSDEQNCHHPGCKSDMWPCLSGMCIPENSYCDGQIDCDDGTDEVNCFTPAPFPLPTPTTNAPSGVGDNEFDSPRQTEDPRIAAATSTSAPIYVPPYEPEVPDRRRPRPPYPGGDRRQEPNRPGNRDDDRSRGPYGQGNGDYDRGQGPYGQGNGDYDRGQGPYGQGNGDYDRGQGPYVQGNGDYDDECKQNQWRCENGPCISSYLRCDGRVDCPYDSSDELDCPVGSPAALKLKTYPHEQVVRFRGDVVFQCRDEGPERAAVEWVRQDGRPLKAGSVDRNGRLEINGVTSADSGVYVCQATRYLGSPGAQTSVELVVENAPATKRPPFFGCLPHQATCGSGECIEKSAICDGRIDCSDKSDEESCNEGGKCQPNEFQCANRKCVLKTWRCDSDDDCGDNSDERDCAPSDPRQQCSAVEFSCDSRDQCVPKSFHCDGQSDCLDHSDEIGCAPVHVTRPPAPSNLILSPGENLTLSCEAVGIPVPIISWRLNWGHVPEKCVATSERGIGNLFCPNMQPEDSGAYSCEAMNNKGTTFAIPDAIVAVNNLGICPPGYFNSEARSVSDCIKCFCFGESTQCHSADLFTYNMPTPLGEGGTRLVGIKQSVGDVQIDSQPVTDQYYYQPLRNGATVTKLENFGSNWWSRSTPYLTLPETYNGKQLTSYGGYIKYKISSHSPRYGADQLPDIIIKGKHQSLAHLHRGDALREIDIQARLTPENWMKYSPRGLVSATREDIMMALDNIESILLRAEVNGAGVNITDFVMESAQSINTGLGAANLVEECTCPPGYQGLSCEKCAAGYAREMSGPWLGNCVREEKRCPPGTYGDPNSGYGCRPCPCPLTNRENQFATTCSIGPRGGVVCDCPPGYEGETCEYCAAGYVGNPLVPGDSCKLAPSDNCNPIGTAQVRLLGECECKENVHGRYCDRCKNESFYLSEDFRNGCALCFCTGVSQQCSSSNLRRTTTSVRFNIPSIVEQVKVYNSSPSSSRSGASRYQAPVKSDLRPQLVRGELAVPSYDRSRSTVYYWSLPASFAGDKVTSYGGYLRYTLNNALSYGGASTKSSAADVQLISDNSLTFHYFGNFAPALDGTVNASVQFLEKGWQRPDGKEVPREHFLLALADVNTILIKATYNLNTPLATLVSASIETAEPNGNGPTALHVEQCVCPPGYIGTSCEDCAPGYTRSSQGLYLAECSVCQCNGHSNNCHPETGVCLNCADNTAGNNCELCKSGYERDAYQNCVRSVPVDRYSTTASSNTECLCDKRGIIGPCDDVYCQCKPNVESDLCDTCRPGTFGLDAENPLGCTACYCSGVTRDCHEASHYSRIPLAAPMFGENYGGYSLMSLNDDKPINDQFVPNPTESELEYIFTGNPPSQPLYWSLPVFPGNRVLSYGGSLSLTQKFQSEYPEVSEPGQDVILVGDDSSLYWTNPVSLKTGESLTYQVPLRETNWYVLNSATPASRHEFMSVLKNLRRVLVRASLSRSIHSTSIADVSMDTASYDPSSPIAKGVEICMCPEGYTGTSCESCSPGYYKDTAGYCSKCNCNGHDCQLGNGEVVCNCRPPYVGPDCSTVAGEPSNSSTPQPPHSTILVRITSPIIKIQEVGSSVNFTCQAQSQITNNRLPVKWSKVDGYLPQGRTQIDNRRGILIITNLQMSDSGKYICQTSDGMTTAQDVATLKVPGNDMSLPSVKITPVVNDYYEGERIQLECIASGNPAPRISWQRASNRPLPHSAEYYDRFFIIDSAKEEDAGEYRCIASNAVGSNDNIVVVIIRPRPSRPPREKLSVVPEEPSVAEGQSIRVVCTATPNVPAGTIVWIRQNGVEFAPNVRTDNGVLYIDYASLDDQGVYLCQSSSSSIEPVSVFLNVIPQGTPSPSELSNITVPVDSLKIATGESGSVECNPSGYPLPLIRWTKYQAGLGPRTSQRDNTLIINNAQEEDQGYYVCEGLVDGSPINNIYVYVEIEKREPPSVEIYPQGEQAVTLGSEFELRCRVVKGAPDPIVTWSRNDGRPLSRYTEIQPHNILKFGKIEVNDEGEYVCSATNVAGSRSAATIIKVRSTPEITITPNTFIMALPGDPVTIECRANGYPEPQVSIRSSVDQRELVPPTPGIAVLRIPSVSERDDGAYICVATSPAGIMDDQFIIRVDRGDGGNTFVDEGSGEGDIGEYSPDPYDRPNNIIAIDGADTSITCKVSEGFEVMWTKADRQPLQRNAYQNGSTLVILRTSRADEGQYECIIINRDNNEIQQSEYYSLRVDFPPRITLRPATQTVRPGQSPTVECVVEGEGIQEITWRPVNRVLSPRVEVRGPTLIFHKIEVEDQGQYLCFARNEIANATATAEVIVNEETDRTPSESHDNEQFAHVGAAVHLSCNVTQPHLTIHWTKDGARIPNSVLRNSDGSLYIRYAQRSDSGIYVCLIQDVYGRQSRNYINLHIEGAPDSAPALISIDQPRRPYRVGENVEVLCRVRDRNAKVSWTRYGTNQYVVTRTYGDGSLLVISGVQVADAGIYRCIGRDVYGRPSYEDFRLEVEPVSEGPSYPYSEKGKVYIAELGNDVDLPCNHNLEQPAFIEWRREYIPLPPEARVNEQNFHLERVTEADAGTYICKVSNGPNTVEARAILRVIGVVPRFEGESWLSLPTIKDAYRQFDIEVSFKPAVATGLILYNSQNQGRTGDYLALQLIDGVPVFILDTGAGAVTINGDRPLQLNTWHTIRLSKTNSRITMDVDNTGPFSRESSGPWDILELNQPLYIGGVPDFDQLPAPLADSLGFVGCVSMLILGREEKNIMVDRLDGERVGRCDSCSPNLCLNDGVCQEARNERGYICLCPAGFAGLNCDRTGEACRPDLCGPGKCTNTADGYKCSCPVTYTGKNCETKQSIEYPAFTGSAYLAIKLPAMTSRVFKVSMNVKATSPVVDGIIMYVAESPRGRDGFISLAVHNGKLELRYDLGDQSAPVILTSNRTLPANEWTKINIARVASVVSMKINVIHNYEAKLDPHKGLNLKTPMFVGGVDESITLNNNTGVTGGFIGCIKDVSVDDSNVNIVNSAIQSANVQECSKYERGDIPDVESVCSQCRNGGACMSPDVTSCSCPTGFSGQLCENRVPYSPRRPPIDPCAVSPCRNGGKCRIDRDNRMNYTCDCPLGFAGANCQMELELLQSVGFNGNGYLELPAHLLRYDRLDVEPALIALAIHTTSDGILVYQKEMQTPPDRGDYILIRVDQGIVVLDWDLGSGLSTISIENVSVDDGERHEIIAKLSDDGHMSLSVDGMTKTGMTTGIANLMNADSNIYIGGIPDSLNIHGYPGLNGCIEQIELMPSNRGLNLGQVAVTGRNTQRCRELRPGY